MTLPDAWVSERDVNRLTSRSRVHEAVLADLVIGIDDPRAEDVSRLLRAHLAFAHEVTPPGHVHALGVDGLLDPAVTFFSARRAGDLVGVGALKQLDECHAELKSMHTIELARGRGVGRALVDHLLATARSRNFQRVSLETGTMGCLRVGAVLVREGRLRAVPAV